MKFSTSFCLLLAPVATAFMPHNANQQRVSAPTYIAPQPRTAGVLSAAVEPSACSDIEDAANQVLSISHDADVIFSIIDVDGSGSISYDEMIDHLGKAGYTNDVIDKIFNKLDVNNDGMISRTEFKDGIFIMTALRSAPGLGNFNSEFVAEIHEDADALFRSVDADGNGDIDQFELKSHMGRKFGSGYTEEAIERIFQLLDVDGNGTISQDELRDAFVRYSALRQAIGEGPNFK